MGWGAGSFILLAPPPSPNLNTPLSRDNEDGRLEEAFALMEKEVGSISYGTTVCPKSSDPFYIVLFVQEVVTYFI